MHWDYLCEEMSWLANDFRMEKKWKIALARKTSRLVVKWHETKAHKEAKELRTELARKKRVAGNIAKEATKFWKQMLQVVDYKQKLEMEAVKREALERHLDFIVGQTERFTTDLKTTWKAPALPGSARAPGPDGAAVPASMNPHPLAAIKAEGASTGSVPTAADDSTGMAAGTAVADSASTSATPGAMAATSTTPAPTATTTDTATTTPANPDGQTAAAAAATEDSAMKVEPDAAAEGGKEKEKDAEFNPDDVAAAAAEDDESTMAAADEPTNAAVELDELADDADVDIMELLKNYPGYGQDSDDGEEDDDGEAAEADADADVDGGANADADAETGAEKGDQEDADGDGNDDDGDEPPAPKRETRGGRKRRRGDVSPEKSASPPPKPRASRSRNAKKGDDASPEKSVEPSPPPKARASRSRNAKKPNSKKKDEGEMDADDDGDDADDKKEDTPEPEAEAEADADAKPPKSPTPPKEFEEKAAKADKFQPKGCTLESTNVKTAVPFLLKATLRPYQHIGLDWLANMYGRKLNGILADEMGLGKTIQTISLLAHLATERGNWGPHLVIVPTSVMLNWELEFKKFCPAFKILTYYGTIQQRKEKRTGWTKPDAFHVCITSYKLAVQDHQVIL